MIKYGIVNYIFGSPGAGKSTVLAQISRYFIRKKVKVYANFPLEGTILIQDTDIGYYNFQHSVILLDEAGIAYNNREAFSKKGLMQDPLRLQYWKLVRHYHAIIFIASQSWEDVDKKVRDLSTSYFLIKKSILRFLTIIKPIYKKVDIDETTHQPTDFFVMDIFIRWKICFRKLYYKYFDSYDAPELPDYPDPIDTSESKNQDDNLKVYHLSKILNSGNKDSDPGSLSH